MRAHVFSRTGGPEVLELRDLPSPVPRADEVLVRVRACGLNHLDLWVRQGLPQQIHLPHIGGCETVGEVVAWGSQVTNCTAGELVLISPTQSCGACPACFRGEETACLQFEVPGEDTQGGFAEFAVARARHVIRLSSAWSPQEWAAVPLTFLTAWTMLHRKGNIQPGDDVLVQGASSGVGSAAIQIAKLAGARVLTTVSSPEKAALARRLGADVIIDRTRQNFPEIVKSETAGRGVQIVLEHVGQAVWKDSLKCLCHGGKLVTCGATTGPKVEIDLRFFFIREIQILGALLGSRGDLDRLLSLFDRTLLRPVLDRTFPLAELRAAHEYLAAGRQLGKVVITIP